MIVEPLCVEETAEARGATHKAVLTFRDLTDAGTSQTVTVAPIAAEMAARVGRAVLKTPFVAPGLTGLIVDAGDGDTSDEFLAGMQLAGAATERGVVPGILEPDGWTVGYTAANTITATFTATGANLNTLTAGEVWVYLEIRDGRN